MFLVDSLPELKDEGLEDEGGKWASSVNFCLFACGVTLVNFFVGKSCLLVALALMLTMLLITLRLFYERMVMG